MIYDYIIIGSGIAGLYLGYILKKNNKNYIVLEKNNILGGRIAQANFHNTNVQLGAGIIRKDDKHILKLLDNLNIKYSTGYKETNKNIDNYNKQEYNNIIDKLKEIKINKNNSVFKDALRSFFNYNSKKLNLFIKSYNYTDHLRADTNLTIKHYPLKDLYDKKRIIHFVHGGNNKIIDKLAQYSNVIMNCNIINIEDNNNIKILTDSKKREYKCKHVISTIDIKALKSIKGFNNDDIKYFKKYIGTNKFLRMYTYHDNVTLDKTTVVPSIMKQMIPINNNVIMSAYCDNSNATKFKKLIDKLSNKDLTEMINHNLQNFGSVTPVKDRLVRYWNVGTHYYKPLYSYKKNYYCNNKENFSIVGEVIAWEQGWMEGSVHSVNAWSKYNKFKI